jgi:hypothetical protein
MNEFNGEQITANDLLNVAVFGKQVELFWEGDLGGYIQQRIAVQRHDAIKKLSTADRNDAKAIGMWQDRLAMIDLLETWITDLITDGLNAQKVLSED